MKISEKHLRSLIRNIYLSENTVYTAVDPSWNKTTATSTKNVVNFGTATSEESSAIDRAVELGEKLGIDPAWIYATEKKESAHNPSAMAWNLHIMVDSRWATRAGVPGKHVTDAQKKELVKLGFHPSDFSKKSYYGSEAQEKFSKAYEVNPWAAIAGGAWGLYQVLGAFTLPLYDNDPEKWKTAFEDDPVEYSKKSLEAWIKKYGQGFKNAVNNENYDYTTRKYYGDSNTQYENDIRSYVAEFRSRQEKK